MDLDAILNEAAEEQFKPEPPKKKIDPPEIRPWLAATACVLPESRDKWNQLVRRDVEAVVPSKFQASNAYRIGDATPSPGPHKILHEVIFILKFTLNVVLIIIVVLLQLVKSAAARCGLEESKVTKLIALVNPVTDNEAGKQLQLSYRKQLIKDLKKDVQADIHYNPDKFPNLARALSHE